MDGLKPLKRYGGEDHYKWSNEKSVRRPRLKLERHSREWKDETKFEN